MSLRLLLVLATLFVSANLSVAQTSNNKLQDAITATTDSLTIGPSGHPLCLPLVDRAVEVHVVSSYKGGEKLDQSRERHPPAYVDVIVEKTAKPILLVLAGYEPLVWRLRVAKDAKIDGIFLTGQYPQMALAIPKSVSVGSFSAEPGVWRKQTDCELPQSMFEAGASVKRKLVMRSFDAIRTKDEVVEALINVLDEIGQFEFGSHQFSHGHLGMNFAVR